VLSKAERLNIVLERLAAERPADSASKAWASLAENLNAVEDEFSGVPCNPSLWKSDGRIYLPQEDNSRHVPNRPSLRRYISVKHNTFIGLNGSIRIQDRAGNVVLDKPGRDGRKTHELDP
jgi:hypothetical protein